MKKLMLISSLVMLGLGGCYVVPPGGHDDGYHNDRDHHDDRKDSRDRDGRDDNHDGTYDSHDQYH
jgi:hypothetical protein